MHICTFAPHARECYRDKTPHPRTSFTQSNELHRAPSTLSPATTAPWSTLLPAMATPRPPSEAIPPYTRGQPFTRSHRSRPTPQATSHHQPVRSHSCRTPRREASARVDPGSPRRCRWTQQPLPCATHHHTALPRLIARLSRPLASPRRNILRVSVRLLSFDMPQSLHLSTRLTLTRGRSHSHTHP